MALSEHWKAEVKPWSEPLDFETWKERVCEGREASETLLAEFYAESWDPTDCRDYMLLQKLFKRHPKPRHIVLTLEDVNKRYAVALWREGMRLLVRRMTPEARAFVVETQGRAEAAAGIEWS